MHTYAIMIWSVDRRSWLINSKKENSDLLNKLDLKCSKDDVHSRHAFQHRPVEPCWKLIEHEKNGVKFAIATIQVLFD